MPAEPGVQREPDDLVEAVRDHPDRKHLAAKIVPPSAFTPGGSYRVEPESEAVDLEQPTSIQAAWHASRTHHSSFPTARRVAAEVAVSAGAGERQGVIVPHGPIS